MEKLHAVVSDNNPRRANVLGRFMQFNVRLMNKVEEMHSKTEDMASVIFMNRTTYSVSKAFKKEGFKKIINNGHTEWVYCAPMTYKEDTEEESTNILCSLHGIYFNIYHSETEFRWVKFMYASFMIIDSPNIPYMDRHIQKMIAMGVDTFVRFDRLHYSVNQFLEAGIDVYDLSFSSNCLPTKGQLETWKTLTNSSDAGSRRAVALHGGGRATFMVSIVLRELGLSNKDACVAVSSEFKFDLCYNQINFLNHYCIDNEDKPLPINKSVISDLLANDI